jgi:twitching motility protein PilI
MHSVNVRLREYQQHLFDRIRASAGSDAASSHLGFEAGGQTWVVRLMDVIEVIPVPALVSVPLTQDWFVGVANIRGGLFAITDFARFANGVPTPITSESRLVLLHAKYRVHAGLLIGRSLGLRQFASAPRGYSATSSWQSAPHSDADGRIWQELSVQELTRDPRFLQVALQGV